MRRTIVILALLLAVGMVSAANFPLGKFSIENPKITVRYTQDVVLTSFTLDTLDIESAEAYTLEQRTPESASVYAREFVLVTSDESGVQPLVPGEYRITVRASDRSGRTILDSADFEISGLTIRIVDPEFGKSDHLPFNITINTTIDNTPADARCEHSPINFTHGLKLLSPGFQRTHIVENVNYRGNLYVICEERTGRKTMQRFTVDWDAVPPTIIATAEPALVRDPRYRSTFVRITTNERSACKLDGKNFAGSNPLVEDTYATIHEGRLNYSFTDNQEHIVHHAISCRDLAGHSNTTTLNVTVNLASFQDIIILSPEPRLNRSSFDLSVTPTFIADSCTVNSVSMSKAADVFTAAYTNLADGNYSFNISCTGAENVTRGYNVSIDTGAPTVTLNASQLICLNTINASWSVDEDVLGYTVTIRDDQGILSQFSTTEKKHTFTLSRQISGALEWTVIAEDLYGNRGARVVTIGALRQGEETECGLPPFIRMVQPPLGFSLASPFTVQLETKRTAQCRYSLQPGIDWSSRAEFDTSDGTRHTKAFSFTNQQLYVMCQEANLKNHTRVFRIGVDDSPPVISVTATPNPVIDPANKIVVLAVTTTDPTYCTYNNISFDGNITDAATYRVDHTTTLDLRHITSTAPQTLPYNITCRNLALMSAQKQYAVQVHLASTVSIARVSPGPLTAEQFVILSVKPNVQATCLWNEVGAQPPLQDFDQVMNNTHSIALGSLDDGSHHYYVECTGATATGSAVIDFTVDRAAPNVTDLSGPAVLCGKSKYYYNVTGLDKEPVITYSLDGPGGVQFQKNTSDAFLEVNPKGMAPGSYRLKVFATSRAGVKGNEASINVQVANSESAACAADLCSNGIEDTGEDGVDCGGPCDECNVCDDDNDCLNGEACVDDVCVSEVALCSNGIQDTGEEGVDCGGTCDDCIVCIDELDCDSDEVCSDGLCVSEVNLCSNRKLDTGETGIDCGGSCGACVTCVDELDCDIGQSCTGGVCVGAGGDHCKNGKRDSGEDNIDCGGTCPNACVQCANDAECPTLAMTCKLGTCVELPPISGKSPPTEELPAEVNTPVGSQPSGCVNEYECEITQICSSGRCVPRPTRTEPEPVDIPPEEGIDVLALVLIILGLMVMGGSGYYLYEQHENKHTTARPPPPSAGPPRQRDMQAEQAAKQRMVSELAAQRQQRSQTMNKFGGKNPPAQKKAEAKKPAKPAKEDVFDKLDKL